MHAVSDINDAITNSDVLDTGPPYVLPEPDPQDEVQPVDPNDDAESQWNFVRTFGFEDDCDPASMCSWGPDTDDDRTANREFSTAQLFWYVNTFRDHLAQSPIGFTGGTAAASRRGDDRVLAQSLDGALPASATTPSCSRSPMARAR